MTGANTIVAAVDTTPIIVAVIGAAGAVVAALLTTRWRREDAKHQRADQELGKRHQDELARLEMRHAAELRDIDLEYEEVLTRTREAPKTLLASYKERVRETRELLQDVRTAMAELGTASRALARHVDGPAEALDLAAPHRLQCKALTDLLTTRAAKIDGDMLPKMKHANDLVSAYSDTRGRYGDRLSAAEANNLRAIAVNARPELDSIIGSLSEYERRLATRADAQAGRLNEARQELQQGSDTWLRETDEERKKVVKRHEDELERLLEQQRVYKARVLRRRS